MGCNGKHKSVRKRIHASYIWNKITFKISNNFYIEFSFSHSYVFHCIPIVKMMQKNYTMSLISENKNLSLHSSGNREHFQLLLFTFYNQCQLINKYFSHCLRRMCQINLPMLHSQIRSMQALFLRMEAFLSSNYETHLISLEFFGSPI